MLFINNPFIPKFVSNHEINLLKKILFNEFAQPFYFNKIIFENSTKVRMTHFDISVSNVNAAEIINLGKKRRKEGRKEGETS